MHLYLVDGQFEIFRCFHGAPRATGPDGHEVGATRGLLHSLVALLRRPELTHIAVAFDRAVAPVRAANAQSDDAKLQSQFGLAADGVRALGIALWPMIKVQADDAIATAVARYSDAEGIEQTIIASADNDFTQCIRGTEVVMLNRNTKKVIDEDGVIEKFGVRPAQIPDYLALVGDVSDGLPGIPGWGAKSTAAVLTRYGSLESIPHSADEWDISIRSAERLATNLRERWLEAVLYRDLSILRVDVPLPHHIDDLRWHGADREAIANFAQSIGESEILDRIPRFR